MNKNKFDQEGKFIAQGGRVRGENLYREEVENRVWDPSKQGKGKGKRQGDGKGRKGKPKY
jgi:hypothetical protein